MPKKKFFSTIFSRSGKSQRQEQQQDDRLETDAVPAPDENSNESTGNQVEEINNSTPLPSSMLGLAEINSQQLVSSPTPSSDLNSNSLSPLRMPANNNMVAVHNTQAQNVFQFSNINNLHIGSVFKIGATDGEPQRPGSIDPPKEHRAKAYTRTVQAMLQSTEPLDSKYLSEISKHLGEGWQDVMRQLKFSDGQIHQATVDFQVDGGIREVIYQLLLDWTRNEENATLGEITTILWNSGHHETVYYVKQIYKAEKIAATQPKSEKGVV